jgi:hypothetical protein
MDDPGGLPTDRTLLVRIVMAYDADLDDELTEAIADARASLGLRLFDDDGSAST